MDRDTILILGHQVIHAKMTICLVFIFQGETPETVQDENVEITLSKEVMDEAGKLPENLKNVKDEDVS